jgi:DNA recombination protein RmuC
VLRINGLAEYCQRECRVIIAGPTTLAALLNSLRVGFATLAIEKKSSEVWKLLGAVKKQYAIFDQLLGKSIKKLEDAQQDMSDAQTRSKQIYTRLSKVEETERADAGEFLEAGGPAADG